MLLWRYFLLCSVLFYFDHPLHSQAEDQNKNVDRKDSFLMPAINFARRLSMKITGSRGHNVIIHKKRFHNSIICSYWIRIAQMWTWVENELAGHQRPSSLRQSLEEGGHTDDYHDYDDDEIWLKSWGWIDSEKNWKPKTKYRCQEKHLRPSWVSWCQDEHWSWHWCGECWYLDPLL